MVRHALGGFSLSFAFGCMQKLQLCRTFALLKVIMKIEICRGKCGFFFIFFSVFIKKKFAPD